MANNIDNLKFVKVTEALLVPRRLFEQVKGLTFDIDDFYKYYGLCNGPTSILHLIVDTADTEEPIKGLVWAVVLPIEQALMVNVVSINKEYQGTGLFRERIIPFLKEIRKGCNLKTIVWTTSRPKAFEKLGYKRLPLILMEERYE